MADEDEFQIEGHFYDVFERIIKNDSVLVKCFSDEKETQLVAEFQHDIQKNITQKSDFQHKTKAFFSFLIKDYIFDSVFTLSAPPSVSEDFSINIAYINPFFYTHYILVLAPPPRFTVPISAEI